MACAGNQLGNPIQCLLTEVRVAFDGVLLKKWGLSCCLPLVECWSTERVSASLSSLNESRLPYVRCSSVARAVCFLDSVTEECRLFDGKWTKEPDKESLLAYTNGSCTTIPDSKNCFKNGRMDNEFLHWRWKPNGCDLPRFDPRMFFKIVRGKTMGFIGDSVSKNHADSLLCLLSKEEVPIDVEKNSKEKFQTWHFPKHDFTLLTLWSEYLVTADELIINGSHSNIYNLHLDKPDPKWTTKLPTLDYAIISDGHWFFRELHLYQDNNMIGCVYCSNPNITKFNVTFAMKMSFRGALKYINECKNCKRLTTFLRTFSPSHFENGTWNNGGNCNRRKPLKEFEVESSEFYKEISDMQNEEIEWVKTESLGKNKHFKVLDITKVMVMRADGHPGSFWGNKWMKGYNDCVHWCLPGPIDVWNDFLLAHLSH
ncbi:xyloglucan O-acetyltransferase 3-like [Rutidosis leptorrhynchoides]|uniref:xyloglucan O-acetyltransferase 3-like n=1 Tax=Rutidosis leptorrhynchoides TaxID=125765 RepID=UPI003A9955EC